MGVEQDAVTYDPSFKICLLIQEQARQLEGLSASALGEDGILR